MFVKSIVKLSLAFALLFVGMSEVFAVDNILNTSIRKISATDLNITFYTNNVVDEAPIVKDKGDNSYVILLPNLKDMSGAKPDLRTVSDIVSEINVKTVNEGAVTYTKVTLTTKKPVKVKVDTRRTTQSSKELSGVNDIIAKVNLINQDVQSTKALPVVSTHNQSEKQEKTSSVSPVVSKIDIPKKVVAKSASSAKSVSAHVPSNTKTIRKASNNLPNENIKNIQKQAVQNVDKMGQNVVSSVQNNVSINDDEEQFVENIEEIDLEQIPLPSEESLFKEKINKNPLSSPMTLVVLGLMFGMFVLLFMFKKMSKMLSRDEEFSTAFLQRINSQGAINKDDYLSLLQNNSLSWQEKYNSFKNVNKLEQTEVRKAYLGVQADENDLIFNDEANELDFQEKEFIAPSVNPFAASIDLLSRGIVVDSADVISSEMRRTLKGFADDKSLAKTKRNVGLKNRFTMFENSNHEKLERNIHELLETVIKLDEEKSVLERAYNAPDAKPSVFEQLQTEHAEAQINHKIQEKEEVALPISDKSFERKNKLKIKESRSIDENKGFYLVDMNDKLALMGRINDKFTVLKKFDDMNKNTLQVRRDKENLYMVRTNGFKALVDVKEDKMGVFAEL